MTHSEVTHYH